MGYICPLCYIDPSNHSLIKYKETNNIVYYYSCPSEAKLYFDCEGIINHYDGILSEMPKDKKWIWIFDSEGFDLKHAMEVQTGIGIAKLITGKYGNNLQEIKIINPTWHIKTMMTAVWPFLNDRTKQKINIMKDRVYSVLEFV